MSYAKELADQIENNEDITLGVTDSTLVVRALRAYIAIMISAKIGGALVALGALAALAFYAAA
ncbi:hypothetical protein [Amorphus sp. MBR-141]